MPTVLFGLCSIFALKYATEAELEAIDQKIKIEVEASVKFAEESPYPSAAEAYTDVYAESDYPYVMD